MSNGNEQTPIGQVNITPEGGLINEGAPPSDPGAGQILLTPEAGPASGDELLTPPTWHEHMEGPILGLDDSPVSPAPPQSTPHADVTVLGAAGAPEATPSSTRTAEDDRELSKWPPYRGKPVTDVSVALRYAAPVAAQAEKLAIRALDLSGRGLTNLARFLQERRQERDAAAAEEERERS